VKPDFWTHPVMAAQSDVTKLLAIGLLNYADDEGYFYSDPRMVRNAIRPLDDDSRSTTVALRELSEIGYIQTCEHATHGVIGKVIAFEKHQVINKKTPSKLKPLFEQVTQGNSDYGSATVVLPEDYRPEQGTGNRERSTPKVPLEGTEEVEKTSDFVDKESLLRLRTLFRKRENTPLDRGEERAWQHRGNRAAVLATDPADWLVLEWFYELPADHVAAKYRRTGLAQLVNNWNAEIVRARAAAAAAGVNFDDPSHLQKTQKEPARWRELLLEENPELSLPHRFGEMSENLRKWAWELAKRQDQESEQQQEEAA
jgi:hypothetical protein